MEQLLNFIYKGAQTKRFHTADTQTSQTVGAHSFGVAWLVVLISPTARKELILAALAHDLAEHIVGDVSSPTKRAFPALRAAVDEAEGAALKAVGLDYAAGLTCHEQKVLKCADMLDGMMFCVRARRMGDLGVKEIYNNFYAYVSEITLTEHVKELVSVVAKQWEEVNGKC